MASAGSHRVPSRRTWRALGITVPMFLPSGESREGCWVEGRAGTKACRLEVRPSQERGGAGFELGRGERDVPGAHSCSPEVPDTHPQTACAARALDIGLGPGPQVEAQRLGGMGPRPLIKGPRVQLAQELGFNTLA